MQGSNLILAGLLAIAIALAAAPAAGYKSGWAYYRQSAFAVPRQLRIPILIKLQIWVGWIKVNITLVPKGNQQSRCIVPKKGFTMTST